jgi:monoamine oxidase
MNAHLWSSSVHELITIATRVIFGAEPSQVSLLYFLHYIKCAGGLERLIDTTGGAQDRKVVGSMYQVPQRLAREAGSRLKLSCVVATIVQSEDSVVVLTRTGETYRSRYVICALPPHLCHQIVFEPALPRKRALLNQKITPGLTRSVR